MSDIVNIGNCEAIIEGHCDLHGLWGTENGIQYSQVLDAAKLMVNFLTKSEFLSCYTPEEITDAVEFAIQATALAF